MTQEQAESVKDLAKSCFEVLEVVTETNCIVCNGTGRFPYVADLGRDPCSRCKGTGKVKWKWKPEVGECFLEKHGESIYLVQLVVKVAPGRVWTAADIDHYHPGTTLRLGIRHWPILHWEELERVLEGVGYRFEEPTANWVEDMKDWTKDKKRGYEVAIWHRKDGDSEDAPLKVIEGGKSRQEAVMRAVIKLGEEQNDRIKCAN